MINVKYERVIKRPIAEVFAQLVDIDRYPCWLPQSRIFLDCWKTSDGPVGLGTTFVDQSRIGRYHGEVTSFKRPTEVGFRMRLRWLGVDVMESRPAYVLEEVPGGTRLQHHAEGELFGLFRIMEPYVEIRARQERIRTVDVLKEVIEAAGD